MVFIKIDSFWDSGNRSDAPVPLLPPVAPVSVSLSAFLHPGMPHYGGSVFPKTESGMVHPGFTL